MTTGGWTHATRFLGGYRHDDSSKLLGWIMAVCQAMNLWAIRSNCDG